MSRNRELYRAERLPVFQNRMFPTPEAARRCARGDVVLVQSDETGLIFNEAFRPELMEYGADYQNEQAVSPRFQAHLENVAGVISRHFAGDTLIEVGCGKGYFLERLARLGFDITGLDPAYEGDDPRILKEYFRPGLGLSADGILLRHVLEHMRDPVGFLAGLAEANGGRGRVYIESPCFDWVLRNRAWFDIFYEHVNYFRLGDFARMFGRVDEAGRVFGGQYLFAVADLATLRPPRCEASDRCEFPAEFRATLDAHAERIRASRAAGRRSAVWGGASKGVIFSLFMERAGAPVDYVIDINPAKQGKHLAATGLRVYPPQEVLRELAPGSDIFVMNSNYLGEIERSTNGRFALRTVDRGVAGDE